MQGQKSAIGSLPDTLGFDHGSASSDVGLDQQVCWNNMRNSSQNHLSDYISPSNTSITFLNSTTQVGENLSGWTMGESSSSAGAGPVMEEQQYEPASILSLNDFNVTRSSNQIANGPLFLHSSSSDSIPRDLDINSGFAGHDANDCQVMERPGEYNPGSSENVRVPSAGSSNPFGVASGSGGFLEDENDGRPGCSLEGRRLSCKRKTLEGSAGQSSGSSSYFQRAESSVWHTVPSRYNTGSSLSISTASDSTLGVSPPEQIIPRLGLGVDRAASDSSPALSAVENAESSRRNYRVRMNSAHQQDSPPANVFSAGNAAAHMDVYHSSRLIPGYNLLDLRPMPSVDNASPQGQPVVHVPALRRNLQSSRWNRSSSSRPVRSLSSVFPGERDDTVSHEEPNSRSIPRNISEHPMFVPATEMRSSAQNPINWSLAGGNINVANDVASTSRTGPSSGVNPSSAPNLVPHRNPPQYPRRLSELVRRSVLSSTISESGGQSSNFSPPRSGTSASSQEMAPSTGAGNQGHHLPHSRSALLLDRQSDGSFGIPYSLRTLAAASEGRSRLVSEIRTVLDLMRRGEGLRLEDVMILDQSVFVGMADSRDRYRDMRLDVDNMSYEELLALEERIGFVSTGLGEETILKRLKKRKYVSITADQLETEPCCICQEEYVNGEDLGALECGHDFHTHCIKQWLMHKNLCPICKTTAMVT
ncbi:hypothetical protein RJ640_006970 [Escallonia rubra]|uniref:RING-type E3 ubiquitin transferase n=1 Tax=Escallonia rubra TaxID=112253 RepID=A0AA88SA18_9ASTE|nr:hypothetical protein RJ640_006970 [Escallonia rubra]